MTRLLGLMHSERAVISARPGDVQPAAWVSRCSTRPTQAALPQVQSPGRWTPARVL